MSLKLIVGAFPEGDSIPRLYTCEGANVSPAVEWTGAPETTGSYALILEDPDAPSGTFTHWLLWDIPRAASAVAQGFKAGSLGESGTNDFGKLGYGGPCPPPGHGAHRYFFRLYALDVPSLGLRKGATRAEFNRAIAGHVLAEGSYMGRFERR
ncbi:MAG: YbhB/YbcL family Raf kinase inhibitor-like protein [bacterium]|jgi:Raf kinase inhibitor-like YbhB/YbcL family protein